MTIGKDRFLKTKWGFNMKYILLIFVVLISFLLMSCSDPKKSHSEIVLNYKCSLSQLEQVKKFVEVCNSTSFFSSFCLSAAMKNYCDLKKEVVCE